MVTQAFDPTLPPFALEAGARLAQLRAGGPGGYWEPLTGPGKALDTSAPSRRASHAGSAMVSDCVQYAYGSDALSVAWDENGRALAHRAIVRAAVWRRNRAPVAAESRSRTYPVGDFA